MKKLFSKIFDTKEVQQKQPKWSFERNGWKESARRYNLAHGLPEDVI
ncbi:hypothetical protein [Streptococcus mutans]|nr:hypothetical protein [Streptococcus mutans]